MKSESWKTSNILSKEENDRDDINMWQQRIND